MLSLFRKFFPLVILCVGVIFSASAIPGKPTEIPLADTSAINILSWNIKMLPRGLAFLKHHPIKRAKLIPEKLNNSSYDVLVLQEAFDRKANRIMRKQLKSIYPYSIGPANQRPGFKVSSGVIIYSRYPMKQLGTVDFKQCEKEDCYARKGALLVEMVAKGDTIQVLGTHLEAGGSRELKTSQYVELGGLLDEYAREGVPQLVCGDFNTHKNDTILYPSLLRHVKGEDGDIVGELQYTSDHLLNDMDSYNPNRRNVIDFIFYRPNGRPCKGTERCVARYCQQWDDKHKDLSDHFGVLMKLKL
jgi:endonuclease/exonuclease/phosphatase family metal-dependent hydrolase